jgi:hypothetical protein
MESPIHDETLSAENYPYRCGIGQGCPHLFSGIGAFEGRKYCVFMKPGLISALARNPKCPYSAREIGRSIVRRVDDKDW